MRILIVEDEPRLLRSLAKALREEGYAVDTAEAGDDGLFKAQNCDYDALVLDVMLPGLDGWQLLERLRQTKRTPVLMLTARDTTRDRVRGLDTGADDYLVKPFELSELSARIEAVLRRTRGAQRQLQVADLTYDLDTLTVTRASKPIKLNPICLTLLETLMRKSPSVVSRSQLEQAVWGDDSPNSDSLRSHIHLLRQAIDKPFTTPLLHTVHGIGFRLTDTTP